MPFGEIVSVVRADIGPLEQDLKKAEERVRQYLSRVNRLHVQLATGGMAGGRLPVIGGRIPQAIGPLGAQQLADASVTAAERAERRIRVINNQAEAEFRRLMASRATAYKEDAQRQVAAANLVATQHKRIQQQALAFYRTQSRLGPVGGIRFPGESPTGRTSSGPGSFITPSHLRGLDESNSKWLTQQRSIAAADSLTARLRKNFQMMGEQDLKALVENTKQWVHWLGVGAVGATAGLAVAFGKYALDTNVFFERSKVTIAEILSLTTKLVDGQGKVVDLAKQQNINYAEASKLIELVRKASIKTALPAQQLVNIYSRGLGFATAAGATPEQAVPLIAQITNLGRALGARDEREMAQEVRAVFTGQNITRSRVGQALGISRQDIVNARAAGNEIQFITERLKAGQPFLTRWGASWEGIVTTFQTKFQDFVEAATGQLYSRLEAKLLDINKFFAPDQIERWGRAFSDTLLKAWDRTQAFFESDGFKRGVMFFEYLATHARQIAEALLAFKSLEVLARTAGVIAQLVEVTRNLRGGGLGLGGGSLAGSLVTGGVQRGFGGLATKFMGGFNQAGVPSVLPSNQVAEEGITRAFGQGATAAAGAGIFSRIGAGFAAILPSAEAVGAALPPIGIGMLALAEAILVVKTALAGFEAARLNRQAADTEQATRGMVISRTLRRADLSLFPERRMNAIALRQATERARQPGSMTITPGMSQEEVRQRLFSPSGVLAAGAIAGLRREPVVDPTKQQQANALKLQAFLQRVFAKTTDDKKEQLRDQEKAEEATVLKTVGANKMAYDAIHRLRAHLTDQLAQEDERVASEYRKNLAEMLGDKKSQIASEMKDTLDAIDAESYTDQQALNLRAAAHYKYARERRDEIAAERASREDFIAQVTGNEIKQIETSNIKVLQERIKEIEKDNYIYRSGQEKKLAIDEAYHLAFLHNEQETRDKIREYQKQATDYVQQSYDQQANFQKARVRAEEEFQNLQQRTAKELRDNMRERANAQRELRRAQEDLPLSQENLQLNRQQRQIRQQVEQQLLSNAGRYAPSLAQQQTARRFATEIAGGDIEASQRAIQEAQQLGYNTSGVGGLAQRAAQISQTKGDLADLEADKQEKRQMEDAQRGIEDAKQRLSELDEKQAEILKSYKDASLALRDDWTKTVIDTAESTRRLNTEIQKLADTMRRSHVPIPAALARTVQQSLPAAPRKTVYGVPGFGGYHSTSGGNVADIQSQGSVTHNYIFNGVDLGKLSASDQKSIQNFAQMLLDLSRRTAPSVR